MIKSRIFGNEKTHLTLTDKAYAAYIVTDPLDIVEHEDEDGVLTYSLRGAINRDDLSAEDVSEWVEALCEEENLDEEE